MHALLQWLDYLSSLDAKRFDDTNTFGNTSAFQTTQPSIAALKPCEVPMSMPQILPRQHTTTLALLHGDLDRYYAAGNSGQSTASQPSDLDNLSSICSRGPRSFVSHRSVELHCLWQDGNNRSVSEKVGTVFK